MLPGARIKRTSHEARNGQWRRIGGNEKTEGTNYDDMYGTGIRIADGELPGSYFQRACIKEMMLEPMNLQDIFKLSTSQ
jgi:hypothetical protein